MLKHFICGIACTASMLWSMLAQVQNFPIKPITLVSPFPAGTVTDSVTRIVAKALSESIGQAVIVDIGRGMAQVNGQKARALAISAANRSGSAPQVPTLQEIFPNATGSLETIIAVQAPAGTPASVVEKLDAAFQKAMSSPEVKAQFQVLNTSVLSLSSKQLQDRLRADNPRWTQLMVQAGIEPQ